MKVVINACFGGFSLSEAGMYAYAKRKGITLYPEGERYMTTYWTVPPEQRPQELVGNWLSHSLKDRQDYNDAYSKATLSNYRFDRNDPDLVAVVEELGESANGECAHLKVVEIPDNVNFEIKEYDGNEHIAESHRTWD